MKHLILFLSLLSGLACKSQPKTVSSSLLWEISGKGVSKPSYLFGTMHILCDSDLVVTEPLSEAFNSTDQLYLELDMTDLGALMQSMMGMMMKNGESLDKLLQPSVYDSVSAKFTSLTGIPMNMMKSIKPMFTSSMLYPSMLGCEGQGWDLKFASMAKEKNKDIKGLETAADQLAMFDSIPYKEQADMLASMVLNMDSTKQSFGEMLSLYKKGDIEQLAAVTGSDETIGKYEHIMLTNRNRNWIPVIEKAIKEKSSFIAVGAAHLGGKNGVIALLRQQGYTIKAVAF